MTRKSVNARLPAGQKKEMTPLRRDSITGRVQATGKLLTFTSEVAGKPHRYNTMHHVVPTKTAEPEKPAAEVVTWPTLSKIELSRRLGTMMHHDPTVRRAIENVEIASEMVTMAVQGVGADLPL